MENNKKENKAGANKVAPKADITNKEILNEIETIALTCYGVNGLAHWNLFENKPLKKSSDAIFVSKIGKKYRIKLYVNVISGVKISEILSETQKRIKYEIEKRFDIQVESVNVFVQNIAHEQN